MPIGFPRIGLLQGALLPSLQAVSVAHALTVAEGMLVVEEQGIVRLIDLRLCRSRELSAQHLRKGQTRLIGNNIRMCHTGNRCLTGTRSKAISPPIGPCATDRLDLIGILLLHRLEKLSRYR